MSFLCKQPKTREDQEKHLFLSIKRKDIATLKKLLLKGVSPNCKVEGYESVPIVCACEHGDIETVKVLISGGAVLNVPGNQPLSIAMKNANRDLVELFLDQGGQKDLRFAYTDTNDVIEPAHYACALGLVGILELLITHGCDLNSVSVKGFRPVHFAVRCGHRAIIKTLSDNNANLEAPDSTGDTPLHNAVSLDHYATVECLLNLDVDTGIKNNDGQSVIDIAKDKGFNRILKLLNRKISEDTKSKISVDILDNSSETPELPNEVDSAVLQRMFDLMHQLTGTRQGAPGTGGGTSGYMSPRGSMDGLAGRRQRSGTPPNVFRSHGMSLPNIAYAGHMSPPEHLDIDMAGPAAGHFSLRIQDHFCTLRRDMRAQEIIPALFSRRVISRTMFESLREKYPTTTEKNEIMLRHVMASSESVYKTFVSVLQETNQSHLANILDQASELPDDTQRALHRSSHEISTSERETIRSNATGLKEQWQSHRKEAGKTAQEVGQDVKHKRSSHQYTRKERAEKTRSHLQRLSSERVNHDRSFAQREKAHETRKSCPANLDQAADIWRLSMPNLSTTSQI